MVVNHFTNFVALYPSKDNTATGMATALFSYFTTFGLADELASDPGSNLTAQVVAELSRAFGVRQVISMVGVHTASGVEGTNRLVLELLRDVCHDKQFRDRWSSPLVIGLVQFNINNAICTETGVRRFDNMFGSEAGTYFSLPKDLPTGSRAPEFLRLLDADLKRLEEITSAKHALVIQSRSSQVTPSTQNRFQPGDLVLYQRNPDAPLPTKLSMPFLGPFVVISHVEASNRVACRHLSVGAVQDLPSDRLKLYVGSPEGARKAADEDYDQTLVSSITGWKGDPATKTTMEFRVVFADGDILWLPYSTDLALTIVYGSFVQAIPQLQHLVYGTVEIAQQWIARISRSPISDFNFKLHQSLFVDLRSFGHSWYDNLDFLADRFDTIYVVECIIEAIQPKHLVIFSKVFQERYSKSTNAYWCYRYGTYHTFDSSVMTLVDPALCAKHPMILSTNVTAQQKTLRFHFPNDY